MEKKLKKYKLVRGSGGGANENTISIEFITGDLISLNFVSKVRQKAINLFGNGASLNTIGTTYGIHIRYLDLNKNREIARKLIKCVELEEELLKYKNENNIS